MKLEEKKSDFINTVGIKPNKPLLPQGKWCYNSQQSDKAITSLVDAKKS